MKKMIDKTIESICSAVQGIMGNPTSVGDISEYAGVISALAELIKANAEYKIADFQGKSTMECYLSSKSSKESWKKFTSIEEGGGVRMDKEPKELKIIFKFSEGTIIPKLDAFIEKGVADLLKKYPHACICIEVTC